MRLEAASVTPGIVAQMITALCAAAAVSMSIYNATQINIVHVSINSRMDAFLALTQKSSKAEGLKQGREENDKEEKP